MREHEHKELGNRVIPREVRSPNELDTMRNRVIVEGGKQDEWNTNFVLPDYLAVPPECTVIGIGNYDLSLVGEWGEDGISFNPIFQTEAILYSQSRIEMDQSRLFAQGIRPLTLITRDGRIYHDISIIDTDNPLSNNSTRLERFLDQLTEDYPTPSEGVLKIHNYR
jgi:hypothetical protein